MKSSAKDKSQKSISTKIILKQDIDLEKYRSIYENNPLIQITIDLNKKITSINKNGAKELGYNVDELVGTDIFTLFILQEHPRLKTHISNVLEHPNEQSSHEMKMLRKNKQEFWVRETTFYLEDERSEPQIVFVCDNITYQKNAEAKAKDLAQSLQNMLDASPLGVLVYRLDENDDLILISTNQSAINILQIDTYALISKKIQDIFPGLTQNNLIEKFKDVLKTGKQLLSQTIKYEDVHFKGEYEFSVMKLSNNTIAVFFTDITEKQKAFSALSKSELKFKTLFESSNDAIFLVKDEIIVDCNLKALETLKSPKDKIIGKSLFHFSPDFQPDGKSSKLKVNEINFEVQKGNPQFFEWRAKTLDGTLFDADVSLKKIVFQNEDYLQAIVRDITERKNSEKIINQQKRELITLMSNLPGMAYRCLNNYNWTMEFVSEGCYQLTGYRKDEPLNDRVISYASLIHKDDQLLVYETVQNAVNNREPYTMVYRIKTWQGIEKWVWEKGRGIFDENGKLICLEGFIADITERKIAEEKINILAHVLKSVSECICITNLRDKIIFVNKSFSRVYGFSSTEIIGKPITFIRSQKNDPAIVKKILPETLAGGWTGELINKRKNGEEFPIHLSTSLITDDNGKPIALAGVSVDITELKNHETELMEAKEKAEQVAQLRSNLFTNISHELRTPLVGILGFAEILRDEINQPEFSDMADMILSSGKRLMETFNSVLDLSRVENDKLEIKTVELELNKFIDDNFGIYQNLASNKGLLLKTIKLEPDIYALVDEKLLLQILSNLINNAIKYTETGSITIKVETKDFNGNKFASISIIDTGIGIKKENLSQIFEEFRQVSEGLSRHFGGTGLGLTITKRFVELMSGQIFVESDFGKGSTFNVIFPLAISTKQRIEKVSEIDNYEESAKEFELTSHHEILMVDNDEASREITRLFLKNICEVDFAVSGEEALELTKNKSYTLILMDINLGIGLSGIETTQRIRNNKAYKDTPIVALTAFALAGEKEEFLKLGCTHYLSKPFLRKDLLELITNIL